MPIKYFALAFCALFLFSCKSKTAKTSVTPTSAETDTNGRYWSINSYINDQITLNYGQPISLYRIETRNGKTDSSMVNFETIDWSSVLTPFRETDISDKKFLEHYNFSMFDDNTTGNRTIYYEAKEPQLFTRKLQITVDPTNYKILSVYVESAKKSTWSSENSRLLYIPYKIIQIQHDKRPMVGEAERSHIDYRF